MTKLKVLTVMLFIFSTQSLFSQQKYEGYYRLKTQFRGESECLEGNDPSATTVHNGAAYMTSVQNSLGQVWKIELQANGYYRLKTVLRGDAECLEGNEAGSTVRNGSAFMDKVKNVSGQYWKITTASNGYVYLQNQFRGDAECLEGNQASSTVHGGNAFMDKKQNVSGQLWKIEPIYGDTSIQVISATWAVGDKKSDVTKRVQEIAKTGLPSFEARNHILFADPAAGQQKTLTVVYVKNGVQATKSCLERKFFEW